LPEAKRREFLDSLSEDQQAELYYDWTAFARPSQRMPDKPFVHWLVLAGRGFGKMLALDTPLPTPDGWTTMGSVAIGDALFDESGKVCRVTAVHPVALPRFAHRVRFADDEYVDACADHLWITWTHADRKAFLRSPYEDITKFPPDWPEWRLRKSLWRGAPRIYVDSPGPKIRTTAEIARTLCYGVRDDLNHCIPSAAPLDLPTIDLPINPYVLGVWLGDGDAAGASLTVHDDDAQILDCLMLEGCNSREQKRGRRNGVGRYGIGLDVACKRDHATGRMVGNDSLHTALKRCRLLMNKHVPPLYLRASVNQRLALLQGLMDTDGGVEAASFVSFTSTRKVLTEAVHELVCSLGMKARDDERPAKIGDKICGTAYRVSFTPTMQVFRLSRKANRLSFGCSQLLRRYHRMIVDVEPTDPVPMRCITVDSRHGMYLAGRGMIPTHNTRIGAETVRQWIKTRPIVNIIAPTASDIRDVCIEGPAGILAICPDDERPQYYPSKRTLKWPNGAVSLLFSAEEPERLRGPQAYSIWLDELAAWQYQEEAFDNAMFGLRLGTKPQTVITTTPKPTKLIKSLVKMPGVIVTRGTTYENRSNLAASFYQFIIHKYEGTRLGRQEINAELLEDNPGALWTHTLFEASRVQKAPEDLERIIVGVDPAVTSSEESDEWGIVVAGRDRKYPPEYYVLDDCSAIYTPNDACNAILAAYNKWHADRIVAEVNNGGDLIEALLRTKNHAFAYSPVHAAHGKITRAEPISALWEQGRAHCVGVFGTLEDQCTDYNPTISVESPDRMDSLVWAMTELSEGYAGGWILEGARRNAEAVTVAPTEPSAIAGELGQAQKVAAVKADAAIPGVFGEEKTVAGKVLTTKLMKPQTNGRTPACPVCGNKALSVTGQYQKCNGCGWDSKPKLDGDGNPVQSFAKVS
jgi:phage terminase large subunit-like protein